MKKWLLLLVIVFFVLAGSIGGYIVLNKEESFVSPIGTGKVLSSAHHLPQDSLVVGFLPYWNLKQEPEVDFTVLDHLVYFGLSVDYKGDIVVREEQYEEPGWTWFKSDSLRKIKEIAHAKQKKVLFSLNAFDNELIDSLLVSENAQNNLINNIISLLKKYDFDGINVDFEYIFSSDGVYPQKENYTEFLAKLYQRLKKENKNYILSADFYANAIIYNNVYNTSGAAEHLDYLVIMAYDFHRPASYYSGPVAPVKSNQGKSITEAIQASFGKINPNKLILGIPLYGYEWQTYSEEPASPTVPRTGALASYQRVHKLIDEKELEAEWDREAMSPYLVLKDDGVIKQIYYENLESLSLKYQLVKQLQLKGVAYWAIGYEGEFSEVWQEAGQKLKNQTQTK